VTEHTVYRICDTSYLAVVNCKETVESVIVRMGYEIYVD
jgi:hypothetical protein